jgi:ABC-2 type transport system permease protein
VIEDIWTMMWKEGRELIAGGGRGRGLVGVLILIGLVSILVPLQAGRAWATSALPVIIDGAYLPFTLLLSTVADTFAGERERHTLETLLASRLSDRAILFGKFGAVVAYGWGLGIVAAIVQLAVANLSHPGGLQLYPASTALSIVVLGLLVAGLAAGSGCLISLRSATVRQAQQILTIGFFVLLFVPIFGIQLIPRAERNQLLTQLSATSGATLALILVAVLLALDIVLLLVALARFQRARLVLD